MAGTMEHVHEGGAAPVRTGAALWSRLGSFLAILPLGVWTVNHLWDNLAVYSGAEAWEKQVTQYANPYSHILTFIIVLAPLLLHAVWGVQRLFTFKANNTHYAYWGNLKYLVQRIAAVGVLFFLGAHIWLALLHPYISTGQAETFADISAHMRWHTPTLIVYLLGTLGVSYHLANGTSGFMWQFGLITGRRSLARWDWVAGVIFFLLLIASWLVIWQMYQAGAAYPAPVD